MKRTLWVVFVILMVVVGLCSAATAAERELVIYSGELENLEAAPWGGGKAELSEDEKYLERETLQIETNGFHEGGRLDLKNPEAMEDFLTDPEKASLVLIVKTHREKQEDRRGRRGRRGEEGWWGPEAEFGPGMEPGMGPGMEPGMGPGMEPPGEFPPGEMPPGARGEWGRDRGPVAPPEEMDPYMEPGMEPGMGPGGFPEDMPPGEFGPGMEPGMMPGEEGRRGQEAPPPMITSIRALLVTDQGQLDSGEVDILRAEDALEDWYTMVVPLSEFAGPGKNPEAMLEHVAFFGNVKEKFWVATVKLVVEDEPLVADAGENRKVKVDTPIKFEAKPQPGDVNARYVWDFDDWDGLQEDAIGQEVTWPFLEPGYYVVTLTVSDRSGDHVKRVDTVDVLVEE